MRAYGVRGTLAVACVMIAGCGGGSSSSSTAAQPSTFRSDFARTVTQFKQTSRAIGLALQSAASEGDAQVASSFRGLATRWQGDLTRLRSITPPPAVAADFADLTAAATRTESVLKGIVGAAQAHNASAARQDGANLVRDIVAAERASQGIMHRLGIT